MTSTVYHFWQDLGKLWEHCREMSGKLENLGLSRVLGAAYCWDTRGIVLGLWRAKGGESGMIGGEGG